MAISILQMWKLTQRQLMQGDVAEVLQNQDFPVHLSVLQD